MEAPGIEPEEWLRCATVSGVFRVCGGQTVRFRAKATGLRTKNRRYPQARNRRPLGVVETAGGGYDVKESTNMEAASRQESMTPAPAPQRSRPISLARHVDRLSRDGLLVGEAHCLPEHWRQPVPRDVRMLGLVHQTWCGCTRHCHHILRVEP